METISAPSPRPAAFTNTVLLLAAQLGAGFFCSAVVLLSDTSTGSVALYGMVAVSALTIMASVILTVVFRRRRRRTWHIPLVGLGVMVAAFLAALLLIDEARG